MAAAKMISARFARRLYTEYLLALFAEGANVEGFGDALVPFTGSLAVTEKLKSGKFIRQNNRIYQIVCQALLCWCAIRIP